MSRWTRSHDVAWLPLLVVLALLLVVSVLLLDRQRTALQPTSIATSEIVFTAPLIPDDPAKHTGGLDTRLMALMDAATQSLDVAVYDFDLANVAETMARAIRRGVRVRMVTDSDTLGNTRDTKIQAALKIVKDAGVPIVPDERGPIMHHKFTVADGQVVQTGSWNYSDGDTYRLNNNQAVFRSEELAQNYTAEFEKMFAQRRFGPNKPSGVPRPSVQIEALRVETFFAPQDRVANRIVQRIERAERKVHFLAFSFTHDRIGQAMLAKAEEGVQVQGVFERTGSNTQFSEYNRMKQAGLAVYQDGSPYAMHHKVILLDDRITMFGSFNFSSNADTDNDENLLIIEDLQFAATFEQEFQRMLTLALNAPVRK